MSATEALFYAAVGGAAVAIGSGLATIYGDYKDRLRTLGAITRRVRRAMTRRKVGSTASLFEILNDSDGKLVFRLKAGDGEILAQSHAYESKDSVRQGIASIQAHARRAVVRDLTS